MCLRPRPSCSKASGCSAVSTGFPPGKLRQPCARLRGRGHFHYGKNENTHRHNRNDRGKGQYRPPTASSLETAFVPPVPIRGTLNFSDRFHISRAYCGTSTTDSMNSGAYRASACQAPGASLAGRNELGLQAMEGDNHLDVASIAAVAHLDPVRLARRAFGDGVTLAVPAPGRKSRQDTQNRHHQGVAVGSLARGRFGQGRKPVCFYTESTDIVFIFQLDGGILLLVHTVVLQLFARPLGAPML